MAQKINFYISAFKETIITAPLAYVGLTILLSAFSNFSSAQTWEGLNPPLNIFNGTIYATTVSKSGHIYAAGDFKSTSQHNFVAWWNGTSWNELGNGASALNANGSIRTLASYQDTIYAAGAFAVQSYYVAKWNGNSWSKLDKNNSLSANDFIYSIARHIKDYFFKP